MASWDDYLDNLISQSNKHCDKAAIIGLDGNLWTTAGHRFALNVRPAEAQAIAATFKSKQFSNFMTNGVRVGGIKYTFIREVDKKLVYAKAKSNGGITIQRTKTALVIGHTGEGFQQGNTNKAVAVIADYLEGRKI